MILQKRGSTTRLIGNADAAHLGERLPFADHGSVRADVVPVQRGHLTPAQTREHDHQDQSAVSLVHRHPELGTWSRAIDARRGGRGHVSLGVTLRAPGLDLTDTAWSARAVFVLEAGEEMTRIATDLTHLLRR